MAASTGKAATRKHLTDIALKALKPGKTATDPLPGRSSGSLLFKCRASGTVEAYYRSRDNGLDQLIKLGVYKKTPSSSGYSLAELREQASRYSRIAAEHGDIKSYLAKCAEEEEQQHQARLRELHEQKRLAELEAAKGSFGELFRDYIEDRKKNGVSAAQIKEFERIQTKDLEGLKIGSDGVALDVMSLKAKDVRPEHIKLLLKPIWARKAQRQAAKVRSFLVAAFEYGLRAEHHIDRSSEKSYGLEMNPAMPVTVPNPPNPGTRALNDQELKQFWNTITHVGPSVGPIMARVFQFAIATAGQRPNQFMREPWSSYDLERRYVHIIDRKGRGGLAKDHYVPLTDRAIAILDEVRALQAGMNAIYPWSVSGDIPIHSSSLSHAVSEWFATEHAKLNGIPIPKFAPRDLRRTCTQIMQRNNISDFDSDALQSHGQVGVVARHYRNSPDAKLIQVQPAIEKFDNALSLILDVES